jgi:hypothetical protein
MKTIRLALFSLATTVTMAQAQSEQPLPNAAATDPTITAAQIVAMGPSYNQWQCQTIQQFTNGVTFTNISGYIELASGLNYQATTNGPWLPAQEVIEPFAGGAVARQGQTKAIFANNLNSPGAIDQQTPDGKRLLSNILGLMYVDLSTGQAAEIGGLQDSQGELISSNQVLYPNAFTGLNADVLFTYRRQGIEQDVVLREQPPAPEAYGLNAATTAIEVFTEFIQPPAAAVADLPDDTAEPEPDQAISWGATSLGRGRAFSLNGRDLPVPVIKRYVTVNGRHFLLERVRLAAIQSALSELPEQASNARRFPGLASTQFQFPEGPRSKSAAGPMRLAFGDRPAGGYVLDYLTLSSAYTNYTFQSDTTYYISGNLTFSGTNTFEGGTVIKYATNTSITVPAVNWLGQPYRPVVLTSKDDNSTGDPISGSTSTPTNCYANPALSVTTSGQTIANFRIACARQAITVSSGSLNLYNAQFVNCQNGLAASSATLRLRNILFANVLTNFNNLTSATLDAQNGTFANSFCLAALNSGNNLAFTNCIFANITNLYSGTPASWLGNCSGFYQTTSFGSASTVSATYPFVAAGAGLYYLTNGCPFVAVGTTNLDAALAASLPSRTVYPPTIYVSLTTNGVWGPTVPRDTGNPALGFHYAPLDYAISNVVVSGSLELANNVAVAVVFTGRFGQPAGFYLANNTNKLLSIGTAQIHNQICTYPAVQEQPVQWGMVSSQPKTLIEIGGTPPSTLEAHFTDFNGVMGSALNPIVSGDVMQLNWRDCTMGPGLVLCDLYYYNMTNQCVNNLFERTQISFLNADGNGPLAIYNNLFRNASLTLEDMTPYTIIARDNLFDGATLTDSATDLFNDHNGYLNTSALSGSGGHDVTLTNFTYATGPLGRFYQTSTNLINVGSTTADQRGLYHYTVRTNLISGFEIKETNSVVDIGYHYVATDAFGNPPDANSDGMPDYLEDANGDGIYGTGDLWNWKNGFDSGIDQNLYLSNSQPIGIFVAVPTNPVRKQ